MFFRNLTFFRFPVASIAPQFDACERMDGSSFELVTPNAITAMAECKAKPVGPMELSSRGWVPPLGSASTVLAYRIGSAAWITIGGEDRILPSSAVNNELQQRIAKVEDNEGRKLGGKARKRLKEDVVAELLPRALIKPYRLDAYLDLQRGFIAVNTSSRKQAEALVSELRHTLGSFPALPLNAEVSPRSVLTGWLMDNVAQMMAGTGLNDLGLELGDECELKDAIEKGAVWRGQRQDLQGDEVTAHLEAGKQCSRLGLSLNDHLSFTFGEDLVVRKLRFLDGAVESLENTERESLAEELDARFALMAGEVGLLFDVLERAFKLSKAEG